MTVTAVGRKITMTWGGATIGGVREKTLSLAGSPIDITDVADSGWQELITSDISQLDVKLKISGITKDNKLKADWFGGTYMRSIVLTFNDSSTLTFNAVLSSYEDGIPYKDAVTFTAEFMSTGTPVYTGS